MFWNNQADQKNGEHKTLPLKLFNTFHLSYFVIHLQNNYCV